MPAFPAHRARAERRASRQRVPAPRNVVPCVTCLSPRRSPLRGEENGIALSPLVHRNPWTCGAGSAGVERGTVLVPENPTTEEVEVNDDRRKGRCDQCRDPVRSPDQRGAQLVPVQYATLDVTASTAQTVLDPLLS